jgi:uncharacterized protein (TIGR02118 family)
LSALATRGNVLRAPEEGDDADCHFDGRERGAVIKAISLLVRKDGMTHQQFVAHWLEVHGPLARAVPGIRRYVQSHLLGDRKRADIPGIDLEIDGIAELWYDDREAMERSAATPEAKTLYADGTRFIGRIRTFLVEEKAIIT